MSKTKLLSKVAKGIAYGDVSNAAIRNILTQISIQIGGKFTEQEMLYTLKYFGWRCPYTGKNLRKLIASGEHATDHIVPQNKEYCGLNVKGNLIIVDKKANAAKRSKDIKDFLLNDSEVLSDKDELGRSREERLEKILQFQKECGYDPERIRSIVGPIIEQRYEEVRKEQENCISNIFAELKKE